MKSLSIKLLVIVAFAQPLRSETACFGSPTAHHALIYFHGIDQPQIGYLESKNRIILKKIAKDLKIKIALPRGNSFCRGQDLCWKHQNRTLVLNTLNYARSQSESCIGKSGVLGFLGFSNGGYLLNKIFLNCGLGENQFAVVVGATGDANIVPNSARKCGRIVVHQGTRDLTYARSKEYIQGLLKRGFSAQFNDFSGGHELKLVPLMRLLKSLTAL